MRDEQSARIGRLLVTTNVPAQIEIDNLVVGRTPMPAPISVASGLRLLAVVAPGQVPVHQEVGIVGGQQTDVAVQLLPLQGALAHLMVRASLPGADVVVDGKLVGHTPMPSSLSLPPGQLMGIALLQARQPKQRQHAAGTVDIAVVEQW